MAGSNIHGERFVDGNAGTLTALSLFENGSLTARTFASGTKERLHITGYMIVTEDAAEVQLLADGDVAGERLVDVKTAAGIPITKQYNTPYICQAGQIPKFKGAGANKSMCTIEGFIQPA